MPTPVDAQLRSAAWERIQLVLRFAGDPGPRPAGQAVEPRDVVPPTRQWRDGDETVARINPFIGPGLRPLAAARGRSPAQTGPAPGHRRGRRDPGCRCREAALAAGVRLRRPDRGRRRRPASTLDVEVDARAAALAERETGPVQRLLEADPALAVAGRVLGPADARAEPAGHPVRDPPQQPPDRQPGVGPQADGRAGPGQGLPPGRRREAGHRQAHVVARPAAPAVGHGRREGHLPRRLLLPGLLGRLPARRPDHPAVARRGRVQDRRLQPLRERRQAAVQPVRPGAQEHDPRDRQLGLRRPVLRGGAGPPRGPAGPDRHPAHGPLLRPGRP